MTDNNNQASEQNKAKENHAKGVCVLKVCNQPHLDCFNCGHMKQEVIEIFECEVGSRECGLCGKTVYYQQYGDETGDYQVAICGCCNREYKVKGHYWHTEQDYDGWFDVCLLCGKVENDNRQIEKDETEHIPFEQCPRADY